MDDNRRWLVALVCVGLLLVGVAPESRAGKKLRRVTFGSSPAAAPDGERLAFVRSVSGVSKVQVARLDGSDERRLTKAPGDEQSPAWSPDSKWIVFSSDRSGSRDLWIAPADGSGSPRQLTDQKGVETDPAWSPDRTHIAYTRDGPRGDVGVRLIAWRGGEPRIVEPDSGGDEWDPTWSPDGSRLAVVTDRALSDDILVFEIDASRKSYKELAYFTHDFQGAAERQPAWNPRGVYIALVTNLWPGRLPERGRRPFNRDPMKSRAPVIELPSEPGPLQVFVMTENGRKKLRVSNPRRNAHSPAWTADGTGLLYVIEAENGAAAGRPEIWLHQRVVKARKQR